MRVCWWLVAGSAVNTGTLQETWADTADSGAATGQVNFADSADNDFWLTGVQLEIGSVASEFEYRSFGDELAKCQRYWCQTYPYGTVATSNTHQGSINHSSQATTAYASPGWFSFPTTMRAIPTCKVYSPHSGTINKIAADGTDGTGAIAYADTSGCFPYRNNDNSGVSANSFVKAHITADAEL